MLPTGSGLGGVPGARGPGVRRRRGRGAAAARRRRRAAGRRWQRDAFGFTWLVVATDPADVPSLVTDVHAVNTSLRRRRLRPAAAVLAGVVPRPGRPRARAGLPVQAGHVLPVRSPMPADATAASSATTCSSCGCATCWPASCRSSPRSAAGSPSGAPPASDAAGQSWAALARAARRGGRACGRARPCAQCAVSGSTSMRLTTRAGDEGLQRPHQVRQVDAVHRRAVADRLVEEDDLLVGVREREPLDEVELGADGPGAARRGAACDGLDDLLGRADDVGLRRRPRACTRGGRCTLTPGTRSRTSSTQSRA